MIARIAFRLPYTIAVPAGKQFDPLSRMDGDTTVIIHPLKQFKEMRGFEAPTFEETPRSTTRLIYNGEPVCEMDTLVVDLVRADFDRDVRTMADTIKRADSNTTIRDGYAYANEFLAMLRNATQNPEIRPIEGPVYLQFINDDGTNLEHEDGKYRITLRQGADNLRNRVVDPLHWDALKVQNFEDLNHRTLLLDAMALFPEPASIILGYSAVEGASKHIIQNLANQQLPEAVAKWAIKSALRESSLKILFTGIFKVLTGSEVLGDHDFAQKFERVNQMRNSIVHRGHLQIEGQNVSRTELSEALADCHLLVKKLEEVGSIPPGPSLDLSTHKLELALSLGNWGNTQERVTLVPNHLEVAQGSVKEHDQTKSEK